MARLVLLDLDEDVEVALNGFFVGMDDPVELVTDDAVTNDAVTDDVVAAIGCWANPADSERTEIQATWFSPV